MRLSCDFRYQPLSEPIEEKSLQPHCLVLEWEEIYAEWDNKDLQYYWKKHELKNAEWDESIRGAKPGVY